MGVLQDFEIMIKTALRADSTLVGLIGGAEHIGDWVKQSTPYPHITIGEDQERGWHNKNEVNYKTDCVIHVWSELKSWGQVNQIIDQLDVILLGSLQTLPVSSSFTIIGKAQRPDPVRKLPGDDKGLIRHGVATYRFWISC